MRFGRAPGFVALTYGLILLAAGITVLLVVPSWGNWLADYPASVNPATLPPEAAPMIRGWITLFGPLIEQVGGYIQAAGYFVGSLITLLSLVPIGVGTALLREAGREKGSPAVSPSPMAGRH